jgi:hypothetical protein
MNARNLTGQFARFKANAKMAEPVQVFQLKTVDAFIQVT